MAKEPTTKKTEPKKTPTKQATLFPVEELADKRGLKPWYLAGLRKAANWAPGKQVTEADFDKAVSKFNQRQQGSGKL